MTVKVQVGPPQIAIHQGQTVLISEEDGQINWPSDKGLYFFDTRIVSSWRIYANGEPWELLNGGATSYYASRIYLTNRSFLTEDGPVPPRTLGLTLSRSTGGGMHEDLDVINHGMKPVTFQLEIALRCDFADVFEVKAGHIVRRGRITTEWSEAHQHLRVTYRNGDFTRAVIISPSRSSSKAVYANGRLSFEVALEPGQPWHCCLLYALADGDRHFASPPHCIGHSHQSQHADTMADWLRNVVKIRTSNEEFYRLLRQALEDMAALRLPIAGTDHMVFLPAAGLPWFVAPFGRDSLIVSLQNTLIYPEFARGALEILGSLQAQEVDDYRDAEPGKILHEMRYGELAHFKLIPHTPYYGTADATPLYLITLHAAWRATGDRSILERYLPNAEAALRWIDESGDRDGDGFQEYQTRSKAGYENMGWKDSGDAVVYPDGTQVKQTKALCELQGYVFDAWNRMAEVFDALGEQDRASDLRRKAAELQTRFEQHFWCEDASFYAFTLDPGKKAVPTIASNCGHLLWSGIARRDRAERVVKRFFEPDLWSGWGIRTLSSRNPAYNPFSYQRGSVWPHDNGMIAMGFKRYGFSAEAARVARDISEAASYFAGYRLPELYAGVGRRPGNFPVQYLGANVPQAWAAGSIFHLVQSILGIQADAPNHRLYVDAQLPKWLPEVTLHGLAVGNAKVDIRFWAESGETKWEASVRESDLLIEQRVWEPWPSREEQR